MVRLFNKFLLFFVFFTQVTLPMGHQAPEPQVDQAAIDRAVERANAVIERMPAILERVPVILERVERRERERKAAERLAATNAVQDQNTILLATPRYPYQYRVNDGYHYEYFNNGNGVMRVDDYHMQHGQYPRIALFKRDLITGGMYLANLASDVLMYKLIKKFRVERITEYMLEHHQEVENLLTHINDELLKIDYAVEDKKMTEAQAGIEKKKFIALIKTFVEKEHTLQSAFFNKEILATIIGRLVVEKVTDGIESSLISNKVPTQMFGFDVTMPLPPFMQASYERNEAGERVACQDGPVPPISVVSLVRTVNAFLFNTGDLGKIFWADVGDMAQDGLKTANSMFGLGIPKVFFNPHVRSATRLATQIASLAWAVKIFDAQSHQGWIVHLEKNHAELLPLMQEYKALKNSATPDDLKKLKDVEKKIEAFIAKGHESSWVPGSDCRSWFSAKGLGSAVVNGYQNLVFYGLIAVKAFQVYRHFMAPAVVPNVNATQPTN